MLALVLKDAFSVVSDHPLPQRRPGEALIRMACAGICDTDVQLARGYMGYRGVLGHEFVGEVLEADDAGWLGKRVVADINAACGCCVACAKGDRHHCAHRTVLGIVGRDGCLAELLTMPERCLVEVPPTLGNDKAVFAEPLAAALHVIDELSDGVRDALVVGDGKLGLLVALALRSEGLDVMVVGHHAQKLAIASRAGARVSTSIEGVGRFALVVEATGTSLALAEAMRAVKPRGTLIVKTTVADPISLDLSTVVVNELRMIGSRCGSLERAIGALTSGAIDPLPLIAARYRLDRADEALRHSARKGVLKVLVDP